MASKCSAKSRRCSSAAPGKPLTESQLAEVRRAVDALTGSGARSVKVHGLIVYLDKGGAARPAAKPQPMGPAGAQLSDGAAMPRKRDDELNARQRRSRRRLDERVARRLSLIHI